VAKERLFIRGYSRQRSEEYCERPKKNDTKEFCFFLHNPPGCTDKSVNRTRKKSDPGIGCDTMLRARVTTSMIYFSVLFLLTSCALFSSNDPVSPKARGYDLTVPSGWRETDREESDRAYRLPSGNFATVNSSCTRNADAPLEVLTKHLLFGSRNVKYVEREKIRIAGSDGLFSRVKATVDGVPFHLDVVVLPKEGCVFDFSLMSPKPIPGKDSQEFLSFVKSFTYGKN